MQKRQKMTGRILTGILGKNVKSFRIQKGLSQEKLGEKIDVSKNTISDIESGKKFARADTLAKIAEFFNTQVYELFKPEGVLPDYAEGVFDKFGEDIKDAVTDVMKKVKDDYMGKIKR